MKKISNWVFGSFFRTMGRFFFFLFFGFLLANILSRSEIKWTDLLGIETIKADTIQPLGFQFYDSNGNALPQLSGLPPYVRGYNHTITNTSSGADSFYLREDKSYYPYSNFDYALINLYIKENGATSYYRTTSNNTGTIYNNGFGFYVEMVTNGQWSQCNLENYSKNGEIVLYTIKCPRAKNASAISYFNIQWTYENFGSIENLNMYLQIGLSYSINFISGDSASIIENQNQNTNQTISTITDSNTTEATSEANNFFESFTSQDNGGISSIITAPLSAISGLASATCSPITLPIPYLDNKQLVLPCMSAIYTEHFGAFFSLYQTIIFGVIAYRMLVSIFMMIQGFKNPDDDKIEVVDL